MPFDPSQPFEVISQPQTTRGSTFGWQDGPDSDPQDNGQFAGGGTSLNNAEDYAALPAGSPVPFGYTFPVTNPATNVTTWVTHRDSGPAKWTGRGIDLAPSAMKKLGATTDDPLVVDMKRAVPAFDPSQPFELVDNTPRQEHPEARNALGFQYPLGGTPEASPSLLDQIPAPERTPDLQRALEATGQAQEALLGPGSLSEFANFDWRTRDKIAEDLRQQPEAKPEFKPGDVPNLTMLRQGKVVSSRDMPMPPLSLLYNLGIPQAVGQQEDVPGEMGPPNLVKLRQGIVEQQHTDKAVKEAVAAIANTPGNLANFVLSPAGMATAGVVPLLAPAVQRLVAAGFTVQQAIDAVMAPTLQGKIEAGLGAALGAVGVAKAPELSAGIREKLTEKAAEPTAADAIRADVIDRMRSQSQSDLTTAGIASGDVFADIQPPKVEPATLSDVIRSTLQRDNRLQSEAQVLAEQLKQAPNMAGRAIIQSRIDEINRQMAEPLPAPEPVPERAPRKAPPDQSAFPADAIPRQEPQLASPAENTLKPSEAEQPPTVTDSTPRPISPAEPTAPAETVQGEPQTTGVANRVLDAEAEAGKIGRVEPGEGMSWQEMVDMGREELNKGTDPQMIARRLQRNQRISPTDFAVLRAERERLAVESNQAAEVARQNPGDPAAQAALQAARDTETKWLREVVQPAKTQTSDIFRGMQGEAPIDASTFEGLRRAVLDQKFREPTAKEIPKLERTAKQVSETLKTEADVVQNKLAPEIERQFPKTKVPTLEELQAEMTKMAEELTPC